MPGFIAPWREAVSPRLLPTVDASSHARTHASHTRLRAAAWGISIALVVLLLFSQVQIIPRRIRGQSTYSVPIDVLRYLPLSVMRPAGNSSTSAAQTVLQAARASNTSTASSSSSSSSAGSRSTSNASNITEAQLESLWSALPFTPVLKHEPTDGGYDDLLSHQHKMPGGPSGTAGSSSSSDRGNSYLPASSSQPAQQPLLAPLEPPQLAHPSHHDIVLMLGIVNETIKARITAAEARAGFISAFEGIVPPSGIYRWQVKPPHDQLQGWQHMGAEQLHPDASSSGSAAAADYDGAAPVEQQAAGYEDTDEYSAAGEAAGDAAAAAGDASPPSEQQRSSQVAQAAAEHLMTYALLLLKSSKRLAPCGSDDDSLPPPLPEVPGGPPGGRLLLAAALQDHEEAMPNLVLQLLLFAVQASPGSLYISIYESGSTDATSYWLDVLRSLLVPLRVPAHIVTGGDLIHRPGQSRVEFVASVRNKAIEPFFDPAAAAAQNCPIDQPQQDDTAVGSQPQQQQQQQPASAATMQASAQQLALIQQQQELLQQQAAQLQQQLQPPQMSAQLPTTQQQQQQWPSSLQQRMLRRLQQWSPGIHHAVAAAGSSQIKPGRHLAYTPSAPFWLPDMFATSSTPPSAAPVGAASAAAAGMAQSTASVTPATQRPAGVVRVPGPAGALTEQAMTQAGLTAVSWPAVLSAATSAAAPVPVQAAPVPGAVPAPLQQMAASQPAAAAAAAGIPANKGSAHTASPACYRPDYVMFLDGGVFFCKSDLQRMLLHRHADMACGWSLHMPGSSSSSSSAGGGAVINTSRSDSISPALLNVTGQLLTEPFAALGQQQVNNTSLPGAAMLAPFPFSDPGNALPLFATWRRQLQQSSQLTSQQFLQQQQLLQQQQQELLQQQHELLKQQKLLQQQQELLKQQQLLQQQQELLKQQQEESHKLLEQQQGLLMDQRHQQPGQPQGTALAGAANQPPAATALQQQLPLLSPAASSSPARIQESLTQLVHQMQAAAAITSQADTGIQVSQSSNYHQQALPGQSTSSSQPGSSNLAGQGPQAAGDDGSLSPDQQLLQAQWQQQWEEQLAGDLAADLAAQAAPEQLLDELEEEGLPVLPAVLERPSAVELSNFPFMYSDAAAGRMVNGDPFDVAPYYAASHPPTVRRLTAGLPVQVYCCWNGLVKLRAEPFRRGLRFRGPQTGECGVSEAGSLLCDDLHRLNLSRVLVDSGVLLTRQLEMARKINTNVRHSKRMPYIRRSRWIEVQGGGSAWMMSGQQLARWTYPRVTCCDAADADVARSNGSSNGVAAAGLGAGSSSALAAAAGLRAPGQPPVLPQRKQLPASHQQTLAASVAAAVGTADSVWSGAARHLSTDMSMDAWLAAATSPVVQPLLLGSGGSSLCRRVDVMAQNFTHSFLVGSQQLPAALQQQSSTAQH